MKKLGLVALVLASVCANGGETRRQKSAAPTTTLDFKADVIEGDAKTPKLFLELSGDLGRMDALVFKRPHFNDFHDAENRRHLRVVQRKK